MRQLTVQKTVQKVLPGYLLAGYILKIMILKIMKRQLGLCQPAILLLFVGLFLLTCEKKGEVIEEIGTQKIYTKQYEKEYATAVDFASRLAGTDKSVLYKIICNPSTAPTTEAYQLALTLKPENHYTQYRDTIMIAQIAEEEGFLDDPVVQQIIRQSRLQTIAQLYINQKLSQSLEIAEEDKIETCEELRRREPARMKPLPLEDCLKVAEGVLRRKAVQSKGQEIVQDVKERVAVRKNEKFDRDNYLENIPLYKTIQEQGGCSTEEAATEGSTQKLEESESTQESAEKSTEALGKESLDNNESSAEKK